MTNEKLEYTNLNADANTFLSSSFGKITQTDFIMCNGCVLPKNFEKVANEILEMEVRDDDIWVCTFPKSGTTWAQEMVWCIHHDLDLETAKENVYERFPFLEFSSLFESNNCTSKPIADILNQALVLNTVDYVKNLPSPRFIKTHLPFKLLPKQLQNNSTSAKIIYVSRNPKDTCVSYYYFAKFRFDYDGSFEYFADSFLKGYILYGPYFDHLKGYWTQKNNLNYLFLTYEEMKMDLETVIYKAGQFLGKNLNEDDVKKLLDHLSFSSMKQNKYVNYEEATKLFKKVFNIKQSGCFMRKGEIGGWREIMDSDLCERFENWEKTEREKFDYV